LCNVTQTTPQILIKHGVVIVHQILDCHFDFGVCMSCFVSSLTLLQRERKKTSPSLAQDMVLLATYIAEMSSRSFTVRQCKRLRFRCISLPIKCNDTVPNSPLHKSILQNICSASLCRENVHFDAWVYYSAYQLWYGNIKT
jgi:hypothetical protein